MEKSDSSRLRRMKEALMGFREQFPFKPLLKSIGRVMSANAHWLALGLLVAVGIFSFWNASILLKSTSSQVSLRMLLNELQGTVITVGDAETGQRGYLLVGEKYYLESYLNAVRVADGQLDRIAKLVNVVPEERSTFDALRQLVEVKFAELERTIQLRQTKGIEAAMKVVRVDQGQKLTDEIRGLADQIVQVSQDRLVTYDGQNVKRSRATLWSILGNMLAALLFAAVLRRTFRERTRVERRAQELARSTETARIQALAQSEGEIESLGQKARVLADFVQTLQERTLTASDKEIESLGQQARDLATSVEMSRIQTLNQSDVKIEALGQLARELARSVETSRIQTLNQSDKEIKALGQQARELATSVETSRIETLDHSEKEIEGLWQQARELAAIVETSRIETLDQSDREIEALGLQAREVARSVETSRIQTLMQSDGKINALGQQARDLAASVETLRLRTLNQSDKKIEALGQQSRSLARSTETLRIQTLNQSNKEIRKLNEELEQRILEREAANKELESFSYSVSHDLRAPLRAIDGFSRIVLEDYSGPLAAEGKAYLQMVRDNTRQMGQLVDDLLTFARLGRQSLTKHTVDPNKIVRRCLAEMTKEQQGRQVEIVISDLPSCNADPTLLKQVWVNLLSNALKYTRKQMTARIEIGCRTAPRLTADGQPPSPDSAPEVIYFVKDNGAGFNMKYVGKLFGVFQRLHRTTDYEGTGVGLAIVQRIIHRHGGRIWGEAMLNQGATFSFTLE